MSDSSNGWTMSGVHAQWKPYLEGLSAEDRSAMEAAINQLMIPPYQQPVRFAQAIQDEFGIRIPDTICQATLEGEKPRAYYTGYPLFAALHKTFGRIDHAGDRAARAIMGDFFADPRGANTRLYYEQALCIRRCLEAVVEELGAVLEADDGALDGKDPAAIALQLHAETLKHPSARSERATQCHNVLKGFVERRRAAGVNVLTQRAAGAASEAPPVPDTQVRRRTASEARVAAKLRRGDYDRPDGGTISMERAPKPDTDTGRAMDDVLAGGRTGVKHTHRTVFDEDGTPAFFEPAEPSFLSTSDRRVLMQRRARMAPTDALASVADEHRLSKGAIRETLAHLADRPLQFIFAWLVLSTAMQPSRLERMRNGPANPDEAAAPWFDGRALRYQLLDGPSDDANGAPNREVVIDLPDRIAEQLKHNALGKPQPFDGLTEQINGRLGYAFRMARGTTPTMSRLRASAELGLEQTLNDPTLTRMISGELSVGYSAQGAYQRLPADELQEAIAPYLKGEVKRAKADPRHAAATGPWLDGLSAPEHSTAHHMIGSARVIAPSDFTGLLQDIELTARRLLRDLKRSRLRDASAKTTLSALLSLVNLQAAHTTLNWMLLTGSRPMDKKGLATLIPRGTVSNRHAVIYLDDKASARYRERRLVPYTPTLEAILTAHQALIDRTQTTLAELGIALEDTRGRDQRLFPARFIEMRSGGVRLEPLRSADLSAVLEAHHIHDRRPANNATRHAVKNALLETLNPAQVDTFLGHDRLGRGLHAPSSLATYDLNGLVKALEAIARRYTCTPLTLAVN
ncbi:hypothetical protein [Spiribacter pallidus]|uniref:hypothetical protein n=1 Tax=Spiribacter pallidus TaxID=1987936 RepID=UPI0034A066F6